MRRNHLRLPPVSTPKVELPRVGRFGGSGVLVFVSALTMLGTLLLVGLIMRGATPVHVWLGVGEEATVEVVAVGEHDVPSGPRSRATCDRRVYYVRWGAREGEFSECRAKPASNRVGDQVRVVAVPWNPVVARADELTNPWVNAVGILGFVALLGWGAAWFRRGLRLFAGKATGWEYAGRVVRANRNALTIRLDSGDQLNVLPAMQHPPFRPGERVLVFASRRSWFRHRPAGPWVVAEKPTLDRATVFTHGWVRRYA